jgi:hypothetical protein
MMLPVSSLSKSEHAEKSLVLRISLPESSVCVGTTELPVEFYLVNIGDADVSVTSTGFGSAVTYMALYDTQEGRHRFEVQGTLRDRLTEPKRSFVRLRPGEAHRAVGTAELKGDFFRRPGFYEVSFNYSGKVVNQTGESTNVGLTSNSAIFEVTTCKRE